MTRNFRTFSQVFRSTDVSVNVDATHVSKRPTRATSHHETIVAGVVLTLCSVPADPDAYGLRLKDLPGVVDIGRWTACRVPLVLEAASRAAMHALHEQLQRLDGVIKVDVVYVGFDSDVEDVTGAGANEKADESCSGDAGGSSAEQMDETSWHE